MSCSQFIEHDEEDKSDTLVVIVNGDGTVSVDRETLERVLHQQCRAAVSVIKLEDAEPDSQSGRVNADENDTSSEDRETIMNKVNLIVEGYYPPPPLSMAGKNNGSADSVVSSTVATPPLPQSSSDFLDLLSEGLEIPVANVQNTSNEGCIGDSLVDAFSEMAPEQLKQVETALHSEKAKQILGDDVTSVLDTLKMKEEDDWVHFDHCYTNIYGNRKSSPSPSKNENVVVQDSEEATYVTIRLGENGVASETKSASVESKNEIESVLPKELSEEIVKKVEVPFEPREEPPKVKKKIIQPISTSTPKNENSTEKTTVPKRNTSDITKSLINSSREKRAVPNLQKVKRKNTLKSEEQPVERIVTEDEVDGVKVFKPTRNDKKFTRPFPFPKENSKSILLPRSALIQTKLNFSNKKEGNELVGPSAPTKPTSAAKDKPEGPITRPETPVHKNRTTSASECDDNGKNGKKETPRKPATPVTPETFGPALFSTPDIIRKINNDEPTKESDKPATPVEPSIVDETADIEKRMSALENGEAILDRIHMQFEMQNKERYSSLSDDDRLLSDLENTDDESSQLDSEISASVNRTKKMETNDSTLESSSRKSSTNDKSENSDKDVDYEDDPNKLWCVCNKPHGNRFMICCDACDNWYHGSCVGVTRPMGEKMELNGTEWLCPTCRKEKTAKERESKLKSATRGTVNRVGGKQSIQNMSNSLSTSTSDTSLNVPTTSGERTPQVTPIRRKSSSQPIKIPPSLLCIECKENEIMPNAIYCGKACIERQVQAFLRTYSSPTDPLPDEQKIIVVDKKGDRDRIITGMRAPSVSNLKEWIIEHPSYEIIKPSAFSVSGLTPAAKKPIPIKPVQKPGEAAKSSTPVSKGPPNVANKTKLAPKFKVGDASPDANAQTSIRQFFESKSAGDANSKTKKIEDGSGNIIIREGNVLRTISTLSSKKETDLKLKEKQRQIRLITSQQQSKQGEEHKLIHHIVRKVSLPQQNAEKEKKRKVEVPIKDKPPLQPKEKSTSKKVELKRQDSKKSVEEGGESGEQVSTAAKGPEPVRAKLKKSLSDLFVSRLKDITELTIPEADVIALATQVEEELFNFFKDTGQKYKNKYRSLVFNLKDQKNNLFRRVADKSLSPHQLVRLTPEELASTELAQWREREAKHEIDMIKKTELENLNQSKVLVVKTHKGELEIEPQTLPPSKTDTVVPDLQPDEIPVEKDRGKTYTSAINRDREKAGASSTKEKDASKEGGAGEKKDRHKKSEHRDRDRHKSRKRRHRSSDRDHTRSRSRRRSKSVDKDGHKSSSTAEKSGGSHRSRSSDKSRGAAKERHQSRSKRKRSRSRRKHRSGERKEEPAAAEAVVENEEPPAEAADKPTEDEEKIAADLLSSYNAVDVDLSDMEPTSTVTIQTPPYGRSPEAAGYAWKGTINMPEVGKVHTVLKEVSGNCDGLDEDLPPVIECVGRLRPEVMWRYISEVKKSGHEILVLRFEVQDETQQVNYLSMYSHFSSKKRMGVFGSASPGIKDFYMMTLASHSPIPQVLLPLDGPGFEDNRSHMLLGIIVRTRRKRYSTKTQSTRRKPEPVESAPPPAVAPILDGDSFTPPHSPTSVFVNNSVTAPNAAVVDDDEPYSPEDDEPYSPGALDDVPSSKPATDLEREMEEIELKIAEEKQKIQKYESGKAPDEMYSPSRNYAAEAETPSVQLPDDLQQLLNSFSKRTSEPAPSAAAILQTDPIISAYKSQPTYKSQPAAADDDEAAIEEIFSSPEIVEETPAPAPAAAPAVEPAVVEAAPVDEAKVSRDPRRKPVAEAYAAPANQPPPPGLEEEFPMAAALPAAAADAPLMPMSVAEYAVPMQAAAPFGFAAAAVAAVPQYPPPALMAAHAPMYMAAAPVFPQPGAMPFGALPAAQMYVPPPTVLHHDPSMIPLPMDGGDQANALKRKATDDDDGDDDDPDKGRKGDAKAKKNSYYSSDAKSRRSDSRSPTRHKGSSYDSHRRGYQRDDSEYGGGSRYSHKHSKGYSSRRSGYWKSGSEYSSSSHRKYSDRNRRSRSSSREKSSRRS